MPGIVAYDAGDGPDASVAVLVPPKVRAEDVTLFALFPPPAPPELVTVIVTVIVSPTLTVVGIADIEDVRTGAAKTKLEKAVEINTNTNIIEIILFFIKNTDII